MGIETGTALLISSIITTLTAVGAQVFAGTVSAQAFDLEAELLEEQGALALLEANEEADRIAEGNIAFRKRQKLMFLKSGVALVGSPLLILEETRTEGAKEVDAIRRRGQAQFSLAQRKAGIARATGRAQFIGGVAGATGSLASGFSSFAQFGQTKITSQQRTGTSVGGTQNFITA